MADATETTSRRPLRRVLREVQVRVGFGHLVWRELLECGHTKSRRVDMFGETNAYRRRCGKCAAGAPVDKEASYVG